MKGDKGLGDSQKQMSGSKRPIVEGKKKKKSVRKFETYIFRLFKEVTAGEMTMKAQCANVLNCLVNDVIDRIGIEVSNLCKYHGSSTIQPRDLQAAMSLALGYTEVTQFAVKSGYEALHKWEDSYGDRFAQRIQRRAARGESC